MSNSVLKASVFVHEPQNALRRNFNEILLHFPAPVTSDCGIIYLTTACVNSPLNRFSLSFQLIIVLSSINLVPFLFENTFLRNFYEVVKLLKTVHPSYVSKAGTCLQRRRLDSQVRKALISANIRLERGNVDRRNSLNLMVDGTAYFD